MSKVVCKSCGSERCGNHAACARRQEFIRGQEAKARAQEAKVDMDWACFMACLYVEMRTPNRLPPKEEVAELDLIRKESPLVFAFLEEIARRRARTMLADMILLEALKGLIKEDDNASRS